MLKKIKEFFLGSADEIDIPTVANNNDAIDHSGDINILNNKINGLTNELAIGQQRFINIEKKVNKLNELVIDVDDIRYDLDKLATDKDSSGNDFDELKRNFVHSVNLIKSLVKSIESLQLIVSNTEQKLSKDVENQANRLNATTEVLLEKISENKVDQDRLPDVLKDNKCPFKKNKGYCSVWDNRSNKKDGLIFCQSCLRTAELAHKGIHI